jgi:hypothetical protein
MHRSNKGNRDNKDDNDDMYWIVKPQQRKRISAVDQYEGIRRNYEDIGEKDFSR